MTPKEINEWHIINTTNDKLLDRRMEPLKEREEIIIQEIMNAINKKANR